MLKVVDCKTCDKYKSSREEGFAETGEKCLRVTCKEFGAIKVHQRKGDNRIPRRCMKYQGPENEENYEKAKKWEREKRLITQDEKQRKEIGLRIKGIRKEFELTQEELGGETETSRETISNYERGKSFPCVPFLTKLYDELGVDLNYVLTGEGSMLRSLKND